jgi:phosphoribosylformylglycinamidine synthase
MGDRDHLVGVTVDLSAWSALPARALLFGEGQGRILVATDDAEAVLATAAAHGVPARIIGTVTEAAAGFTITTAQQTLSSSVSALAAAYHEAIPSLMRAPAGAGAAS